MASVVAAATGADADLPLHDAFVERIGRGLITTAEIDALLQAPPDVAAAMWFGEPPPRERWRALIERAIAMIDAALSAQVATIINHARFQALEGAWRGIAWLARGLGPDGMARVRLLDCRWPELARDLERAAEFDRSALWGKVYEDEFGTPGGVPFSMLVMLHGVRHRPGRGHATDDVSALRQLSQVAAAAFAPMALDADPALFGADAHADLDTRQTLAPQFRSPEYTRFQALQRSPDSRFLALVAPRLLVRAPRRRADVPDIGFVYDAPERPVFAAGALALAHVAIRAFNEHRWPAAIIGTVRDRISAGIVADLPAENFATDRPGIAVKPPLELNLSEPLDRELTEAGIVTLRRVRDTGLLAIHSLPTLHRPSGAWASEIARSNERLGAMLNYILCVSRFAHYIKVIGRDMIGSSGSPEAVEARLQRWLNGYASMGDRLSPEMQARYPLQEARVHVRPVPGAPGRLDCEVSLKPRFQIDQAVSEFQLTTVLARPGA